MIRAIGKLAFQIADAIAAGRKEGLEPTSIYLTPADRDELGDVDQVAGLPIRAVSGKGKSRVYFSTGRAKPIARPAALASRRRPRPGQPEPIQ